LKQVIKRGVTEMADIVVINKADGSTEAAAARAAAAFRSTLSFHRKRRQSWQPTVLTCSAHTGLHVDKLLQQLAEYQAAMQGSGELARLRRHQRQRVAWTAAEEAVLDAFRQSANVRWLLGQMTPDIASGALAPRTAAELLAAYNAMYD
jgi:LAO/AO transport system kinase